MTLEITIDKQEGNAGITIKTDNGDIVQWSALSDEDQVGVVNTLVSFAELFYKTYVNAHIDLKESDKEIISSEEVDKAK